MEGEGRGLQGEGGRLQENIGHHDDPVRVVNAFLAAIVTVGFCIYVIGGLASMSGWDSQTCS